MFNPGSALLAPLAALALAGAAAAQPTAPPPPGATFVDPAAMAPARVAELRGVLDNRDNALGLRLGALRLLAEPQFGVAEFVGRLQSIVTDRSEPPELRLAALGLLGEVFWSMMHPPKRDHQHAAAAAFIAASRGLLDEADPRLQRAGLGVVTIVGDREALDRVAAQLDGKPMRLPIGEAEAIGVLSYVDAQPYWPTIHRAYRSTKDPAARIEALRVLGRHQAAREDIIAAAGSPREPAEVRMAALGSLFAVDRDAFLKVATPLLSEEGRAADAVKAFAIQSMRVERSTSPARQRKLAGFDDDFDRGVRALRRSRGELAMVARQYLFDTDPNFAD